MATTEAAGRRAGIALCLTACALLTLLAVRHVQLLSGVGIPAVHTGDVVLLAVVVALLAGSAALLGRALGNGLGRLPLTGLVGGIGLLLLALRPASDRTSVTYYGSGGLGGAYSSSLRIDFFPQIPLESALPLVAALGLLPVAAAATAAGADARLRLRQWQRVGLAAACAVAALLLLAALERSVALLGVLRGDPQQLGDAHAVLWVGALWALMACGWAARALLRHRDGEVPRLALLVPPGALLGAVLLLLDPRGRHACCFTYAPAEVYDPASAEPVLPAYVPPPLLPDLLLLGGCLLAGVVLPLVLAQLLRVRTRASTPPG